MLHTIPQHFTIYPTFEHAKRVADIYQNKDGDPDTIYCPVRQPNGNNFLVLVSIDGEEVGFL